MKREIDIAARIKDGVVTAVIDAPPLVIETEPSALPIAEQVAKRIQRAIDDQPGSKWDRTGTLRRGISAEVSGKHTAVVAPANRLQNDGIAQKFADNVMPVDPLDDAAVDRAIGEMLDEMLGGR